MRARIAPFASRKWGLPPQSGSSVLDCPAQNQTSPTRTSFATASFARSSRLSHEAFIGASFTHHFPSAPAVAATRWPANVTITFSPASAVPHTGTARSRCSTTPSVNGTPSCTFASAANIPAAHAAANIDFFIIIASFLFLMGLRRIRIQV